jgi:hypothetical protein
MVAVPVYVAILAVALARLEVAIKVTAAILASR